MRAGGIVCAALMIADAASALPFTGDILVQSQTAGVLEYEIAEYQNGALLQAIVPVQAPGSTDQWHPRDLVYDGMLRVYDGTFDPYLASYAPATGAWSYITNPTWSTLNNVSYGGIASLGAKVFVTDMATANRPGSGVVVFDRASGTSQSFAAGVQAIDLTLGLDGKLWVLDHQLTARAYDPSTYAFLGSVVFAVSGTIGSDVRSLAVDASGHFYVASWDGFVAHLNPGGGLVKTLTIGGSLMDIDIAPDGRLVIGTRLDGAWLSDTSLSSAQQFTSGRWNYFVTFIPEPTTGALVALGLVLLGSRRRRTN
jgi:hypothetical protein